MKIAGVNIDWPPSAFQGVNYEGVGYWVVGIRAETTGGWVALLRPQAMDGPDIEVAVTTALSRTHKGWATCEARVEKSPP